MTAYQRKRTNKRINRSVFHSDDTTLKTFIHFILTITIIAIFAYCV